MIRSKAIDVLKTFSDEEQKQFSDFVSSPFHNKNKNLIKLFNVLKKYHPEYEIENVKIYSIVYPAKSYNHDNLKKLMSELLKLCESYLSYLCLRKEKFVFARTLLKELSERKIDDYFSLKAKNLENNFPGEYPEHYNNKSLFEGYKLEFSLTRNTSADQTEIHNNKFSCDTCYYLFQSLIYLHCTTALTNSYSHVKNNSNLSRLIEGFDYESLIDKAVIETEQDKLIFMLANMIRMILCPENETHFYNAKKMFMILFDKNIQKIRDDYTLYVLALTAYCTRKMRERNLKFCSEHFELSKHRLKVLENSGKHEFATNWIDVANTVSIALFLNEIKWAEEFIVNVKNYIYHKDYEYIFHYCKANIEFSKGDFEKSLEHTSKIYFKDHNLKDSLIKINMMCYFELNAVESAYSAIDSFNHQILNTDRYNERYKSLSKSFVDIYKKILRLRENPQKITGWSLKEIDKMLLKKEYSPIDKWFSAKICELEVLQSDKTDKKIILKTSQVL